MRQRVMIAMALACRPRVLLADEPTTALDVTVQAQILSLLKDLQHRRNMGLMLITHAMGIVAERADVVCVMYAGRVVEYARVLDLFDRPLHPYTRGLLASIPRLRERKPRLTTVREIVDDPSQFAVSLGDEAHPWWPEHPAPPGVLAGPTSVLYEAHRGHWVSVWRVPGLAIERLTEPDLAPLMAEGAQRCAS
jgi:ABC-type dipeptide/oligopeptide/nickel transport system ATPase component